MLVLSLPLSSSAASNQRFSDVPSTKHFAEAVNELAERNIIGGYPDGTFKLSKSITRGQAAAIIAKLSRMDIKNVKDPGFSDVSTANGYHGAIAALAEANIIGGYQDGRYGPNDPVKRGQLASILVKAFDLPRYSVYDVKNPFKDVLVTGSHSPNILTLYKLGITTGTSPDTFSVNAPVTRGQAAKLMKATEENKPTTMITLEAETFGFDDFYGASSITNSDKELYTLLPVYGKPGYTKERAQLLPLKEGKGRISVGGSISGKRITKKFYILIKNVNGELKLTLEATDDYVPTDALLEVSPEEKVKNISLSTLGGNLVSDNVPFENCTNYDYFTCIKIEKPGKYIATARFATGEDVRYAIEAIVPKEGVHHDRGFHYDIKTLKERLTYVFDVEELFIHDYYYDKEALKKIGKHTILTLNANDIASITRDPGTNVFRVTAKAVGVVEMEFENSVDGAHFVPGEGLANTTTGMKIEIQEMNGLINITPSTIYELHKDF
ncbi:hypothetical protein SporoP17a_01510 [Sporosarcina ureae]|nr:hypothetical protein SporoP17a_01510 [Sporosarcina ureae]